MAKLKPVARVVLKRKEFKKPIEDYLSGAIKWSDKSLKSLKDLIRVLLRDQQKEICPYCQRLIIPERRNLTEHIEHFLDKSKCKYRKFAFHPSNLILACQGCNVEKNKRDLVVHGKITPVYLTSSDAPFLWPHPYFDDMTGCIRKDPGPVYSVILGSGREQEAANLIRDLKFTELKNIESRYGRLKEREQRLFNIVGRLAHKSDERNRARMLVLLSELQRVRDGLS